MHCLLHILVWQASMQVAQLEQLTTSPDERRFVLYQTAHVGLNLGEQDIGAGADALLWLEKGAYLAQSEEVCIGRFVG